MSQNPDSQKKKIRVLLVEPHAPSFAGILKKLQEDSSLEVSSCPSTLEATSEARKFESTLILCHARKPEDFVQQITMLKLLGPQLQRKSVRAMTTTAVRNDQLLERLNFYGCSEVLFEPVTEKSLLFKVKRLIGEMVQSQTAGQVAASASASASKRLEKQKDKQLKENQQAKLQQEKEQQVKKQQKENLLKEDPQKDISRAAQQSGSSSQGNAGADETSSLPAGDMAAGSGGKKSARGSSQVELASPLQLESDFWIYPEGRAKRIGTRWIVRLIGPAPVAGDWEELHTEDHRHHYWTWTPADAEKDEFLKEQGSWIFRGDRPLFQDGMWTFKGSHMELGFYHEKECYGLKLSIGKNRQLIVARDSIAALRSVQQIRKTLELEKAKTGDRKISVGPQGSSASKQSAEYQFSYVDPLTLESDCWIIGDRSPKWIVNRWAVPAYGPPPTTGRWVELDSEEHEHNSKSQRFWQWIPKDPETDPFVTEQGAWIFYGFMPKFIEDTWSLVGVTPRLGFYYENESYGEKIQTDANGNLILAKDSEAALSKKAKISEAMEKVIRKEAEAEELHEPTLVESDEEMALAGPVKKKRRRGSEEGELSSDESLDPSEEESESLEASSGKKRRNQDDPFAVLPETDEPEDGSGPDLGLGGTELGRRKSRKKGKRSEDGENGGDTPPDAIETESGDAAEGLVSFEGEEAAPGSLRSKRKRGSRKDEGPAGFVFEGDRDQRGDGAESFARDQLNGREIKDRGRATQVGPDEVEYRYDVGDFGSEGGSWEFVSGHSSGGKIFVFLPIEIKNAIVEIKEYKAYWTFIGRKKPVKAGGEFVFKNSRPDSYGSFDELLKPVQQYLLSMSAEKLDLVEQNGPEASGKDKRFAKARSKELSYRGQKEESGSEISYRDSGETDTGEPDPFRDRAPEAGPILEGPDAIAAERPPGPSLSPIALAFLMSELMGRKKFNLAQVAERYCAYVSAACGGLRAELWLETGAGWSQVGARIPPGYEDPSSLETLIRNWQASEPAGQASGDEPKIPGEGILIAPVLDALKKRLGVIVISGAGAELVAIDYAKSIARMCRGLLQGCKEKSQAAPQAAVPAKVA